LKQRGEFVVGNGITGVHSYPMKVTADSGEYAAEQGIAEEEALRKSMEEKSCEFTEKGSEIYAKA